MPMNPHFSPQSGTFRSVFGTSGPIDVGNRTENKDEAEGPCQPMKQDHIELAMLCIMTALSGMIISMCIYLITMKHIG